MRCRDPAKEPITNTGTLPRARSPRPKSVVQILVILNDLHTIPIDLPPSPQAVHKGIVHPACLPFFTTHFHRPSERPRPSTDLFPGDCTRRSTRSHFLQHPALCGFPPSWPCNSFFGVGGVRAKILGRLALPRALDRDLSLFQRLRISVACSSRMAGSCRALCQEAFSFAGV